VHDRADFYVFRYESLQVRAATHGCERFRDLRGVFACIRAACRCRSTLHCQRLRPLLAHGVGDAPHPILR
jgi:hypothetical protein